MSKLGWVLIALWLLGAVEQGDWRSLAVGGAAGVGIAAIAHRRRSAALRAIAAPPSGGGEAEPAPAEGDVADLGAYRARRAASRA